MSKIIVGMSGGVDSSVAAWLLKQQGHEVIGVTMDLWPAPLNDAERIVTTPAEDAAKVAEAIGIPHLVMDFRDTFSKNVIREFLEEYQMGRTPNPCVTCNRTVKWEALLERGKQLGAEYIATGHYARVLRLENGRYTIRNSVTAKKDQTYALYRLTQDQLEHTLMPVGEFPKEQIRRIAEEAGLPVAHKPDSQEICFIPDHDYAAYIRRHTDMDVRPGNFVNLRGEILGTHRGIIHYTVGQRKGLGITFGHPVFVLEIRPETNEVVLGEADEVWGDHLVCDRLNFQSISDLDSERKVIAKIRYSHTGSPCVIRRINDTQAECCFEEPVRAITPGQSVVFYEDDHVLGGGRILHR